MFKKIEIEYNNHKGFRKLIERPRTISQIRKSLNTIEKNKYFFKSLLLKHYNSLGINVNTTKYWLKVENHLLGIYKSGKFFNTLCEFDYEKVLDFFDIDVDSDLGHLLSHLFQELQNKEFMPNLCMEKI